MAAVAEGLVEGMPAAAEGEPVADLVHPAVIGDDGDAAHDPDRAAQTFLGVLHEPDGGLELGLYGGFRQLIPDDKAARGAVRGLLGGDLPCLLIR